jgi:hypothetical protein
VEIAGTVYVDIRCKPCDSGFFGDGKSCIPCSLGSTFSNASASPACSECTECTGELFGAQCSSTHDAVCMSTCPASWLLDETTRMCTKCRPGYYDNGTDAVIGDQCVSCPENHYCESKDNVRPCPDMREYVIDGEARPVPNSPPGSRQAADCMCNTYGGFEGERVPRFPPRRNLTPKPRFDRRVAGMFTVQRGVLCRAFKRHGCMQAVRSWKVFRFGVAAVRILSSRSPIHLRNRQYQCIELHQV